MSILNCWIEPERALVGVDTEVIGADGKFYACSKMIPLPHVGAVLGARGGLLFFSTLVAACNVQGFEFDALADMMPDLCRNSLKGAKEGLSAAGRGPIEGNDEHLVVLVGWSPRLGRMVGYDFDKTVEATEFIAGRIEPSLAAPWDRSLGAFHEIRTPWQMATLAQAQCSLMNTLTPYAAGGGRFIVAEIERESMKIWPVADLGTNAGRLTDSFVIA